MSILRSLAALLVAAATSLAVGCAPSSPDVGSEEGHAVESDEALAVDFIALDVRKEEAEAGFTVLKSRQAYVDFFGAAPPADVKFNKHWVLHHSLGVMPSGGYGTEVTSIDKAGSGSNRTLTVTTADTSPGASCSVTMALTNPQATVRINKHNGAAVEHVAESIVTDCSAPNWCWTVRCANGYACDETVDACVPRECNPDVADDCGPNMVCMNQIRCITAPCPEKFTCVDPCGGLTYDGSCDGATVRWCDGGEILELTCDEGTSCILDDAGFADCG